MAGWHGSASPPSHLPRARQGARQLTRARPATAIRPSPQTYCRVAPPHPSSPPPRPKALSSLRKLEELEVLPGDYGVLHSELLPPGEAAGGAFGRV
jgi:hypothetical protein